MARHGDFVCAGRVGVSLLQALILGLVQGITEFLPISSSAHLILIPWLTGWPDQGLEADIAAHAGTLLAVIVYFRREIAGFVRSLLARLRRPGMPMAPEEALLWKVGLGTIPAALAGLLLYDFVSTTLRSPIVIAWTSIGFGLLLGIADRFGAGDRTALRCGWLQALGIGVAQALALIPGVSRSGITMTAALGQGFDRTSAARLSFLFAIPIGLAATAKDASELLSSGRVQEEWLPLLVLFATSAVVASLVIEGLLAWLQRRGMTVFVVYRLLLGALILVIAPWL